MCGIAGFLNYSDQFSINELDLILKKMGDAIFHRGPDSGGTWIDPSTKVCFSHRRLSIIDLTPAGDQPMVSHSGRYICIFNGEIYNHLDLRENIQKIHSINWRGHSDTETLLAAIELYGLKKTLSLSVGMFSIALFDRQENKLMLARDRMGEKPLYYGWNDPLTRSAFIFGSELSIFKVHPEFNAMISQDAVTSFMRYSYVPHSDTIFTNTSKLLPGAILTLEINSKEICYDKYYDLEDAIFNAKSQPFKGSMQDAVHELEHLLKSSIKQQLLSDVPVGAFLSGGIDSSTVVSLMKEVTNASVKTFSIGFDVTEFNESEYASRVAKHLDTDHVEYTISEKEAIDIIPDIPKYFTEPFADSSQIPTILLSRIARRDVTVALSGDAGDELFAGYNRYTLASNLINKLHKFPTPLRRAISGGLTMFKPDHYNRLFRFSNYNNLGEKIYKLANAIRSEDPMDMYLKTVAHFENPSDILKEISHQKSILDMISPGQVYNGLNDIEKMMYIDIRSYLVDDILVKVDRSAMSTSLETRIPFLDPAIVQFAWSLPFEYKLKGGIGKRVLRELLSKKIPKDIFSRPKMGFGIPLTKWTRYDLKDWVYATLDPLKIRNQGYLNDIQVKKMLDAHMSGKCDDGYRVWDLLMFQSWIDNNS